MKKKLLILAIVLILVALFTRRFNLIERKDVLPEAVQTGLDWLLGTAFAEEEPPLSRGDRGETVKTLQTKLREAGFLSDTSDGIFGEATESAVSRLQNYLHEREETAKADRKDALNDALKANRDALAPQYTGERARKLERARKAADRMHEALAPAEQPAPQETEMQRVLRPQYTASGVVDAALRELLNTDGVPATGETLRKGMSGAEVLRLQTRLYSLNDLLEAPDGSFGESTRVALMAFQKKNGLTVDGVAGDRVQALLFSDRAKPGVRPNGPYQLRVSVDRQRVYAYSWSVLDQEYNRLERTMVCSTGLNDTPTPKGTFTSTAPVVRWGYFPKFNCWAQYLYRINGSILFHSVLYDAANEDTLRVGSLHKLGSKASHGCVRLSVEDAKWIYNHCPGGTTVTVY